MFAASPGAPEQGGGGNSVGGFVGNVIGGLASLVGGIAQVGGSVFHDTLKAMSEAATYGKADWGGGYQTPAIATGLVPAIGHDLAERYGALSPFDKRPASEFFQQLYDKPVSFGLDALTVAAAAAKVGSVAGVASAGGKEALNAGVTATSKVYLSTLNDLEKVNVASRTAKAVALKTALESAGIDSPLRGLLPSASYVREGDVLRLSAETYNPLTRFVKAQTFGRATTTSISDLEHSIANALAEAQTPGQFNKIAELEKMLADAKTKGMARVETQKLGEFRSSQTGRAINKFTSGAFYKDRLRAVRQDKVGWMDAAKASTPQEANALSALILNTDISFADLAPDPKIVARMETQLGSPLITATLDGPRVPLRTAAEIAPETLQKLEGTLGLEVAQNILDKAAELRQRLIDNASAIRELNPTYDIEAHISGIDHMVHDVVHGMDVTADSASRPWQLEKEAQRLRDITRKMPGWETYEPSSMPMQLVSEAYRTAQYMHGAEVIIGADPNAVTQTALDLGPGLSGDTALATRQVLGRTITGPDYTEFANAYRRMGRESPAYYPFIESDRLRGTDWFMPRKKIGAVHFARDPHENFNTGALFKANNYIKDPAEAYARRAARGVRMGGTARMIAAYAERGRPITNANQLAEGETIIAPGLVHLSHQISNKFRDVTEELMAKGISEADAKLKALHTVGQETIDAVTAKLATDGGIRMYAVPQIMAKHMDDAAKWAGLIPSGAHIYVDGPMNVWRSLVLAGSPRWIVNNVLGNMVFSAMQGAPISRAFHLLEQEYKRALNDKFGWNLKTGLIDEVDAQLERAGLYEDITHGGYNVVEQQTHRELNPTQANTAAGRAILKTRQAPGRLLNRFQKIGGGVRHANAQIEAAFRRNSWLTEVEKAKGLSSVKRALGRFRQSGESIQRLLKDGLTDGETKATLNGVNHFFGDFANLGPFERNILRPYIAPFWGFYKFQAKLFLSFPFEYPLRAQVLEGLTHVSQDLADAYGPRPDWLMNAIPLGPPGGGEMSFLTTSGPNPFNGTFQNPLGQLSPLLKIPIEHFTGRSLFTGKQFSDKNAYRPFGSDQAYDVNTGQPIGPPTPGLLESLLGQVPQYDMLKQLLAGGSTYDTATIIDALKGDAAIPDTATGQPKYPVDLGALLAKFMGVSQTSYDLGAYQTRLAQDQAAALAEGKRRRT